MSSETQSTTEKEHAVSEAVRALTSLSSHGEGAVQEALKKLPPSVREVFLKAAEEARGKETLDPAYDALVRYLMSFSVNTNELTRALTRAGLPANDLPPSSLSKEVFVVKALTAVSKIPGLLNRFGIEMGNMIPRRREEINKEFGSIAV